VFERFTDGARLTVVRAQKEARLLDHNYIGTEHLLLGLMGDPQSIAARALELSGLRLEGARARVEEVIGRGQSAALGHIPFTKRAKKVLELSLRESVALGHTHIGSEHLLLGLVGEGNGVAAEIVQEFTPLNRLREVTLRLLNGEETARPQVRLRKMTDEEWASWRGGSVDSYAEDDAHARGIPIERAREHAARELVGLLPAGSSSEGHRFLIAEDESSGDRVGHLWFAARTVEAGRVCWLYDLWVDEDVRGRGYGRALMEALEAESKSAGLSRIELNVFGFNRPAINLYRSLGYTEMGRQMFKELGGG
jgi:ribosomal protein S18 acetylase RimI-like enzyme